MSDHPIIHRCSFTFYQDGNGMDTTAETEELLVELEWNPCEREPFIVLKTSTGFSFSDENELVALLRRCVNAGVAVYANEQ